MPVYEFECGTCGNKQEIICWFEERPSSIKCDCGGKCRHIFAAGNVYTGNEDSAWLKSVPDVIAKDTANPVAREFIKNPTRSNYKAWMKSEGIRPLENNEPRRPEPVDLSPIRKEVWRNHQKRHRIEI